VLFITEFLPWPLHTGGRIRTYHILRQVALRHDVTLVTQTLRGETAGEERIRALGVQLYSVPLQPQTLLRKALTAAAFLASARPYVTVYSHYRKPVARLVRQLTQRMSFDLVHLDHLDAGVYLPDCGTKTAVYLDEHNHETSLLRATCVHTTKPLLRRYLQAQLQKLAQFENRLLRTVQGVGVVSTQDAALVTAVAPETALAVIPNGVDLAFFDIPRRPVPARIVTVGSLDWLPNLEGVHWFLDNVWPAVQAVRPEATLHIVGRNPPRALLRRSNQQVMVAGSVPDVREYVAAASAFVVPLFAGGGTRLKVLEAMAMRVPLVSTSTGIEGIECTPDTQALVADTAQDFVRQLLTLLERPALRERLSTAGRALVEQHYSWDAIGAQLDAFYQRLA
jgi:glycosyltransferase involved in cell wall biosynthesis